MSGRVRWRVVLLTAIPLLVPMGGLVFLAANCEDDWCAGGIWEGFAYVVGFSALVVGATAYLSTRALGALRVAVGGWCAASGVASAFFMSSQLFEHDFMVAMVWAWLSLCFLVGAIVLGRGRSVPAPR